MAPAAASDVLMVRHAIAMATTITKCVATTALQAMVPVATAMAHHVGAASWNATAAAARRLAIAMTTMTAARQNAIAATTVKTTKIRP